VVGKAWRQQAYSSELRVVRLSNCSSYAALIFSGPLARWLSYGITAAFVSSAAIAAVVAWRSSLPFAIADPDSSTAAVIAALVPAMAGQSTAWNTAVTSTAGPRNSLFSTNSAASFRGMLLQSYLFLGSANRLYQRIKALLQEQCGCHFLVFDFRLVTGVDSSAMHSFSQIKRAAVDDGARIVLVALCPELKERLSGQPPVVRRRDGRAGP
jgi:hypothetical protein